MEISKFIHNIYGNKMTRIAKDQNYHYNEVVFEEGQFRLRKTARLAFVIEKDDDKTYATVYLIAPPFKARLNSYKIATTEIEIYDSPVDGFQQLAEKLELI